MFGRSASLERFAELGERERWFPLAFLWTDETGDSSRCNLLDDCMAVLLGTSLRSVLCWLQLRERHELV